MALSNPFNPSFGRVPPIFLDREDTVHKIVVGIENVNSPYQTTMIYGVRGSGKTAMMTDVCNSFAVRDEWIVSNLSASIDIKGALIEDITRQIGLSAKKLMRRLKGVKLSVPGVQVDFRTVISEVTFTTVFREVLSDMKSSGKSLLIAIDEVSATEELRELIATYQIMIREGYHVALIMTGLPRNISELQNDKTLTFLLRSARVDMQPIDMLEINLKYQETFMGAGISIDDDALARITKLTEGYAYAFQLMGYLLWETGAKIIDDATIDSILPEYKKLLYRSVYTKVYEEMSEMDREFVKAMAEFDERDVSVSAVADKMSKDVSYTSVYRRRLMDAQIIASPVRGKVRFALPLFGEYIRLVDRLYE